jgi:tetratricopeptide (TPR) repeat protein
MNNLAASYSNLGRYEDALAMQERVLEFYRRVLPENHPDIGEGRVGSVAACDVLIVRRRGLLIVLAGAAMNNLALSYSNLGRYEDALAMREKVLEFSRRVLPENHPDIGEGLVGIGVSCGVLILRRRGLLIVTCRHGHGQSCLVILRSREA